jgi:hypothetical protein
MTDNRKTCVDPYLDSFAQSFAVANYKAGTIRTYRHLGRKLGGQVRPPLGDAANHSRCLRPPRPLRIAGFFRPL